MRRFWLHSILARTTLILLVSAGLTGAVFIVLASAVIAERAHSQAQARLGELIDTVERTVSIACYLSDKPLAAEVAQGLLKNREVASVLIRGENQTELASQARPPPDREEAAQNALQAIHRQIVSPFDPGSVVGELVLVPDPVEISRLAGQNVAFVRSLLILELVVLSVVVMAMVLSMVIRPIRQVSNRLHAMNARAGDKLLPPLGHAKDEIGRLVGDVNVLADHLVSALREEQALRQQGEAGEKKYHAIFDYAEAGICLLNESGRVTSHNPAFARLTGMSLAPAGPDGPVEGPMLSGLPCREPAKLMAALAECFQSGTTVDEQIELMGRESASRWLHLSLTPIGRGLAQGVINDITELTLAKQMAESASRARSAFLSSMSHELRTPLNAILGYAQLIQMGEALSDDNRENIGVIAEAGQHLLDLIDDIMDLAKIEAGYVQVAKEPVLLGELFDACAADTAPLARERQVALDFDAGDYGNAQLWADGIRTKQVLLNFITNAIKYNARGGAVRVYCRAAAEEGRVRLLVEDTGPGIAPGVVQRLFTPFGRLGAERNSIEGTGIGLVLSRQLADLMGGTVGVESEQGKGSVFWLELPCVADEEW